MITEIAQIKREVSISCAFTGHRPHKFPWKYNESDSRCIRLKQILNEQISLLEASGITDYYSGMADGSDIWMSQAVLALREKNSSLKLHCVLPCEGQSDKWSAAAKKRYIEILGQADSVTHISREYYDGCMLERNRKLVDSAETLLAVYNGERRGGTAATIRYARNLGRKIIVINPVMLDIIHG